MNIAQLKAQEEQLVKQLNYLMKMAEDHGAVVRVLGALAIRIHCPQFKHIEYKLGRQLTDIDLTARSADARKLEKMFAQLGWEESSVVRMYSAGKRLLFTASDGMHLDIFYDQLAMCHDINLKGRLEIDYPTISLVDIVLEKMQIVKINEKDLIDTTVLLLEHDVGDHSKETVDAPYLASLCCADWGLWRTVTMNMGKLKDYIAATPQLSRQERQDGEAKVAQLLEEIDAAPKCLKWRMRAKIGDKKKWYRDVDELMRH